MKGGEKDMADKQELGEANAVMFTNYRRADGFEVSFTLRNGSGSDLMKKFDQAIEAIKAAGGTPLPFKSQGGGFSKPVPASKPCPVHQGQMMTEKQSKKEPGKTYFSHSKGKWGMSDFDVCYGHGFKSEQGQTREPYEGEY